MDREIFARWLQSAIATTNLAQNDSTRMSRIRALASRSHCDVKTIARICSGDRGASPTTVYAIGEALAADTQAPCWSGVCAWAITPRYYVHAMRLFALTLEHGPNPALKRLWPGFVELIAAAPTTGLIVHHPRRYARDYHDGLEPRTRPETERRRLAGYDYAQFMRDVTAYETWLRSKGREADIAHLVPENHDDWIAAQEYRDLSTLHHELIDSANRRLTRISFAAVLPHLPVALYDVIVAETSGLSFGGKLGLRDNLRDWAREVAEADWRYYGPWMRRKLTIRPLRNAI